MPKFLFVPSVAKGNGSGHLVRCLALARETSRTSGSFAGVFLPDPSGPGAWGPAEIEQAFAEECRGVRIVSSAEKADGWDYIVLDRRSTDPVEEAGWRALAPTVALDEGGAAFGAASYCIDILPRLPVPRRPDLPRANLESRGFLSLPDNRRNAVPDRLERVLLAFGGEDPGNLGPLTARALVDLGFFRPECITLVSGALRRGKDEIPEGVVSLGPVRNLKERLASCDLVMTQFGLTAFEAAWARCAVILVNPGPYHSALSRRAGFLEAGVGRPDGRALASLLAHPEGWKASAARAAPRQAESLSGRLAALKTGSPGACPICGGGRRVAVARYPGKSYFRCGGCGILYRELFSGRDDPYVESYFFEEYKKQYGRTYLEDFPALTAFASQRLDILERLIPRRESGSRPSVLDVGCAYGAFLAEAARRGWDARGVDIAPSAVEYVIRELKLPAATGDFWDPMVRSRLPEHVDCLTQWFVIEHFDRLGEVLSAAARIVRPGGIFAFSTPSGSGISARSNPEDFFSRSPDDHVTLWEPRRAAGILKRFGFRLEHIRVTGHHPERFPGILGRPAFRSVSAAASQLLGLGDTFECYARRALNAGAREG